jgi:nitrogen-specific signal transduction histidine kinase
MSSLPKVYQTQGQLSAVQLGIVRTAEENYAKSKNKLSTMYVTGV